MKKSMLVSPLLGAALLLGIVFSISNCHHGQITDPLPPLVHDTICKVDISKSSASKNPDFRNDSTIRYQCHDIIVNANDQSTYEGLLKLGYKPVDSCSCNPKIKKMQLYGGDPVGIISNPPAGNRDSSMMLNVVIPGGFDYRFGVDNGSPNVKLPSLPPTGKRIKVGVLDSGVDYQSPSPLIPFIHYLNPGKQPCGLKALANYGIDMSKPNAPLGTLPENGPEPWDYMGHGTFVSYILTKPLQRNDFSPILVEVKITSNQNGQIDLYDATCGMYYAMKQKVKIINLSWGYLDRYHQFVPYLFEDAIKEARNKGIVLVAALGNDGLELNHQVSFWPASFAQTYDNMIAVGASEDNTDTSDIADLSNRSTNPNIMDVLAPGVGVQGYTPEFVRKWNPNASTSGWDIWQNSGRIAMASGTSFSAPEVARFVGELMSKQMPKANNIGSIKAHIKLHKYGNGVIDYKNAYLSW